MSRPIDTSNAITRCSVPALDAILGHAYPILDHGFVRVIDYMGDDAAVVQAARNSYGDGTSIVLEDFDLLRLLLREYHTTPFEMASMKFHFRVPMYIGEQVLRQRTAKVNKLSGRYSVMPEDKYVPAPERMQFQSKTNKQGSEGIMETVLAMDLISQIEFVHGVAQSAYDAMVGVDLSRELARGILPANQYTEFYWKIDLHNLLKFLKQRMDHHAQWEIQQLANTIWDLVLIWCPISAQALKDYWIDSLTLSRMELETLRVMLKNWPGQDAPKQLMDDLGMTKREIREFKAKVEKLKG